MIDRSEIIRLAGELGLQPRVVEKDYVLSWVLAGIARLAVQRRPCLKKCFFETYRFSEDLDFTVIEPVQLDRDFLIGRFKALATWLYDTTGIERPYLQQAARTFVNGCHPAGAQEPVWLSMRRPAWNLRGDEMTDDVIRPGTRMWVWNSAR
jgi:hypothetical protein